MITSKVIQKPAKGVVLIAALSGRALSEAAARSGYVPLVADLFGDADTRLSAFATRKVKGNLESGFDFEDLCFHLEELSMLGPSEPLGVVYGAGFEQNIAELDRLPKKRRLLGTPPEILRLIKDPVRLKAALDRLSIPMPRVTFDAPPRHGQWLVKSVGGAGGGHIRRAWRPGAGAVEHGAVYFQEEVAGVPVSALFLGAGGNVLLVGFSEQWTKGTEDRPFRFGGACHLDCDSPLLRGVLDDILDRMVGLFRMFPVVGLFSVDFLIDGSAWWLLDINPRPGATLDIFDIDGANLFEHHMNVVAGHLPAAGFSYKSAAAAEIVYNGRKKSKVPKDFIYPEWIKDQPAPGALIGPDEPICTVLAIADNASNARRLCKERVRYAQTFFSETRSDRKSRHDSGRLHSQPF